MTIDWLSSLVAVVPEPLWLLIWGVFLVAVSIGVKRTAGEDQAEVAPHREMTLVTRTIPRPVTFPIGRRSVTATAEHALQVAREV